MNIFFRSAVLSLGLVMLLIGCQKDWDGHNGITDERLNTDLNALIKTTPELSKFAALVAKAGYDTVLSSSRTYTVFAPTNNALAGLDPAIENDPARLKPFVANHIAYQSFYTTKVTDTARILMASEKYQNMLGKKVSDANITEADKLAKNGVLQVVDKMLPVLPNCWDALMTSGFPTQQANFLKSLDYVGFDPAKAEVIGIDPNTGNPVYKPGTGAVPANRYWDKVYDLRKEEEQFTFFAVENAELQSEVTKFKGFFNTGVQSTTDSVTSYQVLKDFAFQGRMELSMLPDTLVSKFGVKVGINKANIVRTISCSNGIIYVMSGLPVATSAKFSSRIIEAENYLSTSHDRRNNTLFRDRFNAVTGKAYRDVLVFNHGVAMFNMRYSLPEVASMRYRVYWVAVNDFQTATFNQRFSVGVPTGTTLPYVTVPLATQTEVLIGEINIVNYQNTMDFYLVAANTTAVATNPIVCDYIRLEPVN